MSNSKRSEVIHLSEARTCIPGPAGEHSVSVLQRGTLNLKLSVPVKPNRQSPHAQDEIYVIVSGRGVLFHGHTQPVRAGRRDVRCSRNGALVRGLQQRSDGLGCVLRT
jgi:hypothetical protein